MHAALRRRLVEHVIPPLLAWTAQRHLGHDSAIHRVLGSDAQALQILTASPPPRCTGATHQPSSCASALAFKAAASAETRKLCLWRLDGR